MFQPHRCPWRKWDRVVYLARYHSPLSGWAGNDDEQQPRLKAKEKTARSVSLPTHNATLPWPCEVGPGSKCMILHRSLSPPFVHARGEGKESYQQCDHYCNASVAFAIPKCASRSPAIDMQPSQRCFCIRIRFSRIEDRMGRGHVISVHPSSPLTGLKIFTRLVRREKSMSLCAPSHRNNEGSKLLHQLAANAH
jgi:hypothetical protein